MTLKTSITIGLAAAMLVFGVEAASARLTPDADQQKQADFWNYDSRTGEKVTNSSPGLAPKNVGTLFSTSRNDTRVGGPSNVSRAPDAFERAVAANLAVQSNVSTYPDAFERAAAANLAAQSNVSIYPDAFERAVAANLATQSNVSTYRDAFERAVAANLAAQSNVSTYRDAFERAVASRIESGPLVGHTDRYELDLPNGPVATSTTASGREIEWPQLGIGFGIGMALVIGLILALRLTRSRQLAHG